ncbi:MAG: hypothetical protein M1819_006164 [Sarea resinae]|nr:MAG: hypothetical protein M1819_006164 [Sarea resinae]
MSSNLYDAGSDADSFSEELSPTDGYFGQRSHPQDMLIRNPEAPTNSESKAHGAREESEESTASPASNRRASSNFPHRSESPTFTEHSSLLLSQPPPPAYSAAPSQPPFNAFHGNNNGGPAAGVEEILSGANTQAGLSGVLNGTPGMQSMSSPEDPETDDLGEAFRRTRRKRRLCNWSRRNFVKSLIMFLIVGLSMLAVFLVLIVPKTPSKENKPGGSPDQPSKAIDPQFPPTPSNPSKVIESPAPPKLSKPSQVANPRFPNCQSAAVADVANISFNFEDPAAFAFYHFFEDYTSQYSGDVRVSTTGEVNVKPAQGETHTPIKIDIQILASDPHLLETLRFESTASTLSLYTPPYIRESNPSSSSECLRVLADIWVAPGLALNELGIATGSLDIRLLEKLDFSVKNTTALTSISGNIHTPSNAVELNSRTTIIDTVSGTVSGNFELLDLLSVKTKSGTIDIGVTPKKSSASQPAPAEFITKTISGTIKVDFPIRHNSNIPPRDYRTDVQSVSGSVFGSYLHGTRTKFSTISGTIKASLLAVGPIEDDSYLETFTRSGDTTLNILPPISYGGKPMRHLNANHQSTSATLNLQYPGEWEGEIAGSSLSGSIDVAGKGVKVVRDGKENIIWRNIVARKGHGDGEATFKSISGSVSLVVGTRI